ncbi:integral membrane protein, putative [Talaromyces stipitatus ATCC 10500]|uniref:Integral membrane protein, putative n=1 Tax=Talaromyces stipitatus (strain ATCC 10500 / CBS 375.48 / QM 6759 / NRRL 1006) TaxID=441959 RepID=B8LZP6_TALSN|nr:integral membrane protein, putative [Talaromyces stipitatus ATCC 10500]EED22469.1 integral membrane protein, putative [Talaromyces stipitatus ATCC 10500]
MATATIPGSNAMTPNPTVNNVNPIAVKQIIASVVLPVLAVIATGMRFWARRIIRVTPSVEDWLIVVGLIWTIGYAVVNILLVTIGGVGWSSTVLVESEQLNRVTIELKLTLAGQVVYALALGCIKASICLQLIRLFWIDKLFRYLGFVLLALSIGWALQTMLIGFLICRPISHNWNTNSPGTCGDLHAAYISVGIVDAVTDGLIFLLPIPKIGSLQLPNRTKLATSAIFALGLLTIASGIVRTVQVAHLQFDPNDTGAEVDLCVWSVVEPSVGIIVACMIVMRPLFLRFGEKFLSWGPWTTRRSNPMNSYDSSKIVHTDQSISRNHQFVKLGPKSDAIPLNSMGSSHDVTMYVRASDDHASDKSHYQTISASKKQKPVNVV